MTPTGFDDLEDCIATAVPAGLADRSFA